MRRHLDPMRNITWVTWVEPIDDQAFAAIAEAHEVHRGGIYAASTFLLAPPGTNRWQARESAKDKLLDEMRRRVHVHSTMHRFGMPLMAWLRDLRR